MAGASKKIAFQPLYIHRSVGNRLGAIDHHHRTGRVRETGKLADRIDRPQCVGDVGQRNDTGPFRQQFRKCIGQQLTCIIHGSHPKGGAGLVTQQLPGHDIRVVLHRTDQNLVSAFHARPPVTLGHQIDRFGGTAGENYLCRGRSIDQRPDLLAGAIEAVAGTLAEPVYAAVHIGIVVMVELSHRVDHASGFLGGGAVIEVYQRVPVNLLVQYREITTQRCRIQRCNRLQAHRGIHHGALACAEAEDNWPDTRDARCVCNAGSSTPSRTSAANAWVSIRRAVARSTPRETI